jgi:hypothetical protein
MPLTFFDALPPADRERADACEREAAPFIVEVP